MIKKFMQLLPLLFALAVCVSATAQEESSYKENLKWYKYKKHQSEVGVHFGNFMVNGDVTPDLSIGGGLHYRRAIDYALSWRVDFLYGIAKGVEPENASRLADNVPVLNNLGYGTDKSAWYPNFRTQYLSLSVQGVYSLNSFNFKQQLKKINYYVLGGIGADQWTQSYDALNGNSVYDFSGVADNLDPNTGSDRGDIRGNIKDLLDGDYETDGPLGSPSNEDGKIHLHANLGLGLSFKIAKNINLSLEHQLIIPFGSEADLLDGYRIQDVETNGGGGILTQSADVINYTNLRVNFNIGKKTEGESLEPLYWVGPLDLIAEDVAETAERVDKSLRDSDGDGVFDMFDNEENTVAGAPVDVRGVTLDSDGDKVPNYKDKEPFSPPGYDVDADGIAQIPDPGYTTEDDVNKIVDAKLADFRNSLPVPETPAWFLPLINFGFDSYTVRRSEYGKMHQVATVLKDNDNVRLIVRGYTDRPASDCYNQLLSFNRAESAKNYLVEKYGIAADRLIIDFAGENDPVEDTKGASTLNRRVEFRVAKGDEASKAMPDCGVKKAGKGKKANYGGNRQGY